MITEFGDFFSDIFGLIAASTCNSPSMSKLGQRSRTVRVASTTFSTKGLEELPLVENESSATLGSTFNNRYLGNFGDFGAWGQKSRPYPKVLGSYDHRRVRNSKKTNY